MAAYRPVHDSRHPQADCQEPGSALEPYARQSSMGYFYVFEKLAGKIVKVCCAMLLSFIISHKGPFGLLQLQYATMHA